MSKVKQFIKNISPLNNRTEMPVILYIIKVIIIFWFVKFGAEVIGEGIVMAILFATGRNPLQGEMFDPDVMMLIMYYGYALLTGVMILYWKLFQKKTVAQLGFTQNAGTYFIGGLVGVFLVVVSAMFVILTGTIKYNGVFSNINYLYIILMLGGFIFQGAMEEVLCRGIVLQLLKDKAPIPVAVGISTVLFIIPHLSSMTGASAGIVVFAIINLVLISLILSFLTLHFKSIWAACGLHSFWNFILFNILGLNLSGNDGTTAAIFDIQSVDSNILNGGQYGIEASAVTAVVLAAALAACIVISRNTKKSVEKEAAVDDNVVKIGVVSQNC